MMDEKWPFLIIRCYGTGLKNRNFIRCTFDAQTRHPGLVEEIWFAGNALEARDANLACAEESLIYRDECEKRNIRFSYQHGITLNHHADGKKREALFPGDVWAVTSTGETCYGLFCANSETSRAYTQETAEFFLSRLQPDSYWPDDDLRLSFKAKPDSTDARK